MSRSKKVYCKLPYSGLQIIDIANGLIKFLDDIKTENKNGAISMDKAAEIGALSKKFKGYFEKNIIKTHKWVHH